jgi:hypothetical protein
MWAIQQSHIRASIPPFSWLFVGRSLLESCPFPHLLGPLRESRPSPFSMFPKQVGIKSEPCACVYVRVSATVVRFKQFQATLSRMECMGEATGGAFSSCTCPESGTWSLSTVAAADAILMHITGVVHRDPPLAGPTSWRMHIRKWCYGLLHSYL